MIHIFEDIYDSIFGNERLASLRKFASKYGYNFTKRINYARDLDLELRTYEIFNKKKTKSLRGVLQKREESLNLDITLFDFIYYGNGGTEKTTVAILNCQYLNIPYTMIRPVSTLKKIGSFFKLIKDEEVIPGFSDDYEVFTDEVGPQLVLSHSLVSIFKDYPGLTLEAEGNNIVMYSHKKIVEITVLENFINTTLDAADSLLNDCSLETP